MTEDLQASCECCFLILHTCYRPAQPRVCPSAPRRTHQENHSGRHGVNKPEVFVIQRKFSLLYENISMHEWKENETESKKSSAKSVVFPSQEKLAPAAALYVAELFALPQPHVNRLKSIWSFPGSRPEMWWTSRLSSVVHAQNDIPQLRHTWNSYPFFLQVSVRWK